MRLESTLRSRRSFLHLASLIDIVFLLLLFFLLSSDAIVRSGIAVKTPSWEENEDDNAWALMHPVSSSNVITVSAGSTSQVYLNDRLVDLEELLDVSRLKRMGWRSSIPLSDGLAMAYQDFQNELAGKRLRE